MVAKKSITASGVEPIGMGRGVLQRPPPSTTLTSTALPAALMQLPLMPLPRRTCGQDGQDTGQKAKARNSDHLVTFELECENQKIESGRGKLAQNCSVPRLWALFGLQALE